MLLEALAHAVRRVAPRCFARAPARSRGGGGGGELKKFVRIHLPRNTGDVRVATERLEQDAALPQQPAAIRVLQRHSAERVAEHAVDAVVLREPLVDERVVGADQDRARSRPRAARSAGTARSRAACRGAGCRRRSGTCAASGDFVLTSRSCSHCSAKSVTSVSARGSASILRTCASSAFGSASRPAIASSRSASSGMLFQRNSASREASVAPSSWLARRRRPRRPPRSRRDTAGTRGRSGSARARLRCRPRSRGRCRCRSRRARAAFCDPDRPTAGRRRAARGGPGSRRRTRCRSRSRSVGT